MGGALSAGEWAVIVATVATAVFTGVQMWLSLIARSDQIAVDIQFQHGIVDPDPVEGGEPVVLPNKFIVAATVRNRSSRSISIVGLEVWGVPLRWIATYDDDVVRTHAGFRRQTDVPVLIDKATTVLFEVDVNVEKLRTGHSFGKRSPMLRASVIIDRNTFPKRIVSRSQSKLITEEIMMQAAANAKSA